MSNRNFFPSDPTGNRLIQLPKPLLYKILSELDPEHLAKICSSSVRLRNICKSREFWDFKERSTFNTRPDYRKLFYDRQFSELQSQDDKLRTELQNKIQELIVSAVGVEDKKETFSLARYLLSNVNFEPYSNFESEVIQVIRGIQPTAPLTTPILNMFIYSLPRINPNFESRINLNSPVFANYPLSDFRGSPLHALVRAIYDVIADYKPKFLRLFAEIEKLREQLLAYEDEEHYYGY